MSDGEGLSVEMEGKSTNRQSSVPPKGNGPDTKKESSNGNKQRNRRKDYNGNGSNGGNRGRNFKPDCSQGRYTPQKGKGYDKRPRPRGNYNDNKSGEVNHAGPQHEYGSVQSWGSKKTNMNHLLNFHYESPRTSGGGYSSGWSGKPSRKTYRGNYNKERFLQANCQFLVRETGDYSRHMIDPDLLVDWDLIEQVTVFSYEEAACPICLYPPVAAKITRCGHIYCWPCILHYLSLDDKSWRKCPICYESVHASDLKSAKCVAVHPYKPGEVITLRLMKKPRGSTAALPKGHEMLQLQLIADGSNSKPMSLTDNADTRFVKLLTATPDQVDEIVKMEMTALQTLKAAEEKDSLEVSFIEAAMKELELRDKANELYRGNSPKCSILGQARKLPAPESSPEQQKASKEEAAIIPQARSKVEYSSAFDDNIDVAAIDQKDDDDDHSQLHDSSVHCEEDVSDQTPEAEQIDGATCASPPPIDQHEVKDLPRRLTSNVKHVSDSYYFYQADDGQNIYLHSLNARCLVKQYGGLEFCPQTITAEIVELEPITMDEELRRRLRYLSHLPLTCGFLVAELNLTPPLISSDTLKIFSDDFERRKKLRQRKQRDDRRRAQRIRSYENQLHGIDPTIVIVPSQMVVDQTVIVPSGQRSKTSSESCESTSNESVATTDLPEVKPGSPGSGLDDGGQTSTISFARMLREGKAREAPPAAAFSPNPKLQLKAGVKQGSDSDDADNEDRVPVPVFQASFSDAIQTALDSYLGAKDGESRACEVSVSAPTAAGSKKKKKPKKLLFTTAMNRTK